MKVFVAVSKLYAKQVLDALSSITPRPRLFIASPDPEVEVLSRVQGYEFLQLKDVEKLYTVEGLKDFDVAIAALDSDAQNIAVSRLAKTMGIPIVIAFLHSSLNRDELLREGATAVVDLEGFVSSNIRLALSSDSWSLIRVAPTLSLSIAIHRVVRRGILGVSISSFREALEELDVRILAFDKTGRPIGDDKPLENGDSIVLIGPEDDVLKAVKNVEGVFRRYEQVYAMRYTSVHRYGGFG